MDDDAAFMQLVLSNAQGELSNLEKGTHAMRATERGQSIDHYAKESHRPPTSVHREVQAARVAKSHPQGWTVRAKQLSEIHACPPHCWPAIVQRVIDGKWTVDQTNAAVRAVNAIKPPRGYEKLFAVEKLQEMAAAGQDTNEATRLAIRAIERARADIRDVQFASAILGNSQDGWAWPHPSTPIVNLHRRHLDESQRAMAAARAVALYAEDARKRMLAGTKTNPSANLREGDPADARQGGGRHDFAAPVGAY